ncbi:MAG: YkgJ family cysteine cluster protein [Deltaproteobacteria bacterium]|nr:MAG: YkgJ family cysteine cluster protein [Deltaproteobacteria bacterium]
MDIDFQPYFREYEALRTTADAVFEKVCRSHRDEVKCKPGCDDCCYALFDLTFIEALYINHQFLRQLSDELRESIVEKASHTDRRLHKIKREAAREAAGGGNEEEIISRMGRIRSRCPLLNDENQCDLYDYRPITCRLYGIPLAIGGKGHTCGISGFNAGTAYPTVSMDKITHSLYGLSSRLVRDIESRYHKMGEVLVPLSMALITEYDDTYLGLGPEEEPEPARHRKKRVPR